MLAQDLKFSARPSLEAHLKYLGLLLPERMQISAKTVVTRMIPLSLRTAPKH